MIMRIIISIFNNAWIEKHNLIDSLICQYFSGAEGDKPSAKEEGWAESTEPGRGWKTFESRRIDTTSYTILTSFLPMRSGGSHHSSDPKPKWGRWSMWGKGWGVDGGLSILSKQLSVIVRCLLIVFRFSLVYDTFSSTGWMQFVILQWRRPAYMFTSINMPKGSRQKKAHTLLIIHTQ